jgi:hypothetical protein
MKLEYSTADLERWRDKKHRRTPELAVTNERQALAFIKSVGFCLASKADSLELPNLWDAVSSEHSMNGNGEAKRNYYLSYAWDIQSILPNHGAVYYGKVFKRRPSVVSREYFPYFFALSERSGEREEYKSAFTDGELSATAKAIMDKLMKSSPMTAKDLRESFSGKAKHHAEAVEKALEELQRKMFICRLAGNDHKFGAEWLPLTKCFTPEIRLARKISLETARFKLLEKYFENQLISSVDSIHRVFGWSKKTIFETLGRLVGGGVITATVSLDGKKGYYGLIH